MCGGRHCVECLGCVAAVDVAVDVAAVVSFAVVNFVV